MKGFGSRYGRRIRSKLGKFQQIKNTAKKCPSCRAMKVKREAVGIWKCHKCGLKFAGGAYEV